MFKRIPVIVVSGFLGSGKTTLIRYLLRKSKKKFGIIINEFGDVGIDGDLIRDCSDCDGNEDQFLLELNNGCLCCTVQDDFIPSIQLLLKSNPDLEFILIETSGLALPVPLIQALNWPEIRGAIYLDMVIGTVNGEAMMNGKPINNLDEINSQYEETKVIEHNTSIDELFNEQLEVSDLVVISRADVLKNNDFNSIKQKVVNKVALHVPIIKSFNGEFDLSYIFGNSSIKNNYTRFLNEDHDHSHMEVFSKAIKSEYFLDKKEFDYAMSNILKDLDILRIKGRAWIPGKAIPLQIQIVGKKINTWFEESPTNCWKPNNGGMEIVVIGFNSNSFDMLNQKIKDKFNIYSDPKPRK